MLVPKVLEQALKTCLQSAAQQAFLETFSGYPVEDGDKRNEVASKFANKFATVASSGLAQAIDSYIKSATITGGVVNTVGSPTAQTGPITVPPSIQ